MVLACLATGAPALAQDTLPVPTGRPMTIDFAADPILRLRREQTAFEPFRAVVAAAVERHPGTAEGRPPRTRRWPCSRKPARAGFRPSTSA